MKRIISIGLYLFSCICLAAQTTRTYTLKFDRKDFSFTNYAGGEMITSSKHNIVFDDDTLKPAIPYVNINILMPEGHKLKDYTYTIGKAQKTEEINLPANPKYIFTNLDSESSVMQDEYPLKKYPLIVEFVKEEQLECYRYARFRVPIIAYNAVSKIASWPSKIDISIETEPLESEYTTIVRKDVVTRILQDILFNPEDIFIPTTSIKALTTMPTNTEIIHYLIITSERLKNSFEPLADWKTIKGVKAKVVTVEEIYEEYASEDISDQLKIKKCIYDYYSRQTNNGLNFVLLGGDETIVPVQDCYGQTFVGGETTIADDIPTDLFYANLTGRLDWNADGDNLIGEPTDNSNFIPNIAIGRFPVNTTTQANLLVQRSIAYERNPPRNDWHDKLLLVGTNLNTNDAAASQSENMFAQYIQPYWNEVDKFRLYDTATDFDGGDEYDANAVHLQEQINRGYHHIHVNSHGEKTFWYLENSRFLNDSVNALENTVPTIIATTACGTNAFDGNYPCLSEALLHAPNSGIVSFLGASREGIDYTMGNLGPSSRANGIFYQHTLFKSIGESLNEAKVELLNSDGHDRENYRWVAFALNLMGDPELKVYTDTPQELTGFTWNVQHRNLEIYSAYHGFTATLTSKDDNGKTFFHSSSSSSSATLTFPMDIDNYQLCITASENHIPALITDLASTYIQNVTYTASNNIIGRDIYIGSNINPIATEGPVVIESGSITFDATNSVTIKNGFECKMGATLEIK